MKKVIVVGAGGYVGANLSFLLAKEGYQVTAICFPEMPNNNEWLTQMEKVIVEDVTSKESINRITDNYFDVAIHLVSLDHHESEKAPEFVSTVNVTPVWSLLHAFKTKGTLKRFIYFSTIHVYGEIPFGNIDETLTAKPKTPYGLTHLMAEEICNLYNRTSNIDCINVRMSNSYGSPFFKDNNCWWLVVNDLCRTAFFDRKIVLKSDGSALRDFIHHKDVFNAIKVLMNNRENRDENTFHISSGSTFSILQLAQKVQSVFEKRFNESIPVVLPDSIDPSVQKNSFTISNKKLQHLGFKPTMDIESGINELFDYFERKQ